MNVERKEVLWELSVHWQRKCICLLSLAGIVSFDFHMYAMNRNVNNVVHLGPDSIRSFSNNCKKMCN
jgi:hypothetical protein